MLDSRIARGPVCTTANIVSTAPRKDHRQTSRGIQLNRRRQICAWRFGRIAHLGLEFPWLTEGRKNRVEKAQPMAKSDRPRFEAIHRIHSLTSDFRLRSYTQVFHRPRGCHDRPAVCSCKVAFLAKVLFALAVSFSGSAWPQSSARDETLPVTVDGSCEFRTAAAENDVLNRPEIRRNRVAWINMMLSRAVAHCNDGSTLSLSREHNTFGDHDMFTVAAHLCGRPDIAETRLQLPNNRERLAFRCSISKLASLKAKQSAGRKLYVWPDDWIAPRPSDSYALTYAPGATPQGMPPKPQKSAECDDTNAPGYMERCGLPLTSPAPASR
jgi:hypothetical protein